jgi:hypothetical protein
MCGTGFRNIRTAQEKNDLIQTFKTMHGIDGLPAENFFL